jgi:hypothetical protein
VPEAITGQSPMRQQSVVMGPERPEAKVHCNAQFRSVLSSERAPKFRIKTFADQDKESKIWSLAPESDPTPR